MSGHPRDAKKVPVTGAGRLRECKTTEFVWELEKRGFVKVAVSRAVLDCEQSLIFLCKVTARET